ncbi:MAG: phosphoribosylformylglycinamidine synthase subunit PurS [Bacillota bacterium]|nr:phosphoribosylformylglycinamidine synthase subunit PurS [Bacillota bacterium]
MKHIAKSCTAWKGAEDLLWKAKVEVTLKKEVRDPQGLAVEKSLKTLGYETVQRVRVGKYMEVFLDADSREKASDLVKEMSQRLLSNPVIEDFSYTLQEPEDGK